MTCKNLVVVWHSDDKRLGSTFSRYTVPCGKCVACLMSKRQDWITRLKMEHRASSGSVFLTLTYDRENLPEDGRLSKRDFQLFIKRVRKKVERLRYYCVGEYGSKTGRPHYHAVLFNVPPELKFDAFWKKGITHVGKVTAASVAYVTKYIVQPKNSDQFSLMSRAYGLGLNYLTDAMVAWHREDGRLYMVVEGVKVKLPRYYREKIWRTHEVSKLTTKARWEFVRQYRKELKELRANGYPGKLALDYITEMRNAVLMRVKKKVAFTQTF